MQTGVLTLTSGSRSIGIRFGMQAIMAISADELLKEQKDAFAGITAYTKMAWYGYRNWCLWMEQPAEMTYQQFMDFLDEVSGDNPEIFGKIASAFQESSIFKGDSGEKKMTVASKKSSQKK